MSPIGATFTGTLFATASGGISVFNLSLLTLIAISVGVLVVTSFVITRIARLIIDRT